MMNTSLSYASRAWSLILLAALPLSLHAEPTSAALPPQALTKEILWGILVGDFAANRGDLQLASQAYSGLAIKTRDPRIARRATELAVVSGNLQQASDASRIWAETDPASPEAQEMRLALQITAGELAASEVPLRNYLESHPERRLIVLTRLPQWLDEVPAQGRQRFDFIEAATRNWSEQLEVQYARAYVAMGDHLTTAGLEAIDRVLQQKPDWAKAALLKASLLKDQGGTADSDWLESWQKNYGANPSTNAYLGRLYLARKNWPAARATFSRQMALDNKDAFAAQMAGLLAFDDGDYPAAETALRQALQRQYETADESLYYLALIEEKTGRSDSALQRLAAITDPDWRLRALARSGEMLHARQRTPEALEQIRKARSQGDHPRLYQLEANLYRQTQRLPEALRSLSLGLKKYPGEEDLLYDQALLLVNTGRLGEAETQLKQLIQKNPEDPLILNALGYMLADHTGRFDEARELIEKAHRLKPDDPFILDSLGWVCIRQGRLAEGIPHLQKAYDQGMDPEIAAHLIEGLWRSGRKEEARQIWKQAAQNAPDHEALKKLQHRIQEIAP